MDDGKGIRVNVTHFQSKLTRTVCLSRNLDDFRSQIKKVFNDYLRRTPFQVYRLPFGVADIAKREKISPERYQELRTELMDLTSTVSHPCIYVWDSTVNEDGNSPSQKDLLEHVMDYSSISTDRSFSNNSTLCKVGQRWTCMACGLNAGKEFVQACHILGFEECKNLSEDEVLKLLQSCGLIGLEELVNLITLCTKCHDTYFDKQLLGIDIDEAGNYFWIAKEKILNYETPNGETYGDVAGRKIEIQYPQQRPPEKLIRHRLKRFHAGQVKESITKKRKKSNKVIQPFSGGKGDKAAFFAFLRDSVGIEDFTFLEVVWIDGTTVVEQFRRLPTSSTWEPVPFEDSEVAEFYFNPTTGVLRYRM
mmetsp:Transcript_17310/g.23766  ORF Transcript_17310/g.23766 Transcript_17310/m.23766 type:complete len:363 (-) Transcript_17310:130-1218(-)